MRASPQGSIGCCPDAARLDTSIHSPEGLGQRGNQPGRGGGGRGHFANVQNRASDTLAPGAIVADAGRHLGVVQRARVSGLARASRPGRDGSIHAARPKERRRAPRSKQGREDLGEEGRHARRCGQVRGGGAAETKGAAGTAKKKGAKRVAATKAAGAAETKGAERLVAAKSAQGARKRGTGHFTDIKSAEELSARLNIVSPQLLRQAWRVFVGIGKFEVNAQPYGDEAWLKAAARRRPSHSQRTEVSQARWEGRALGSHWYMDALPESESFEASMQAGNAMAESISKRVFIFYAEFKSHASFMDLMTECTRLAGPLAKKITSNGYQEQRFCKPHRYAVRQRAHAA